MGEKYCWKKHPTFKTRCTKKPGHDGYCTGTLTSMVHFGKGACVVCSGVNLIEHNEEEMKCQDCGNRQLKE